MANYELQANEAVLLKAEQVMHGGARFGASFTDELVLTNLHLIWVSRGMFGVVKKTEYLPLRDIKVFNDQAQAILTTPKNGFPALEVYLQSGEKTFQFSAQTNSGRKKEALKWADAINGAVTGNPSVVRASTNALPGSEALAKTLGATVSQFKSAFGGGPAVPPAPQRVTAKCGSCGAPLSGLSGTVATCPYCDSGTKLA